MSQIKFEELVESGSYFSQNAPIPRRGIRGPIDRFMMNVGGDNGDKTAAEPTQITPKNAKEMRNKVCMDIGRCFFENALPFHLAKSPSFINMCRSIGNYGRGLKPPSMYELRTWILKELKTTDAIVEDVKKTWPQTGVSIMSDGWSDIRNRSIINILVNNPSGTVFYKSVDASSFIKDAKRLFKMLDDVIEEIGEHLVIQVVTDNASAYKAAGTLLMEKRKHLYWTPCAAHCLDLMLEKIGELPQHKNAKIEQVYSQSSMDPKLDAKICQKRYFKTCCHKICNRISYIAKHLSSEATFRGYVYFGRVDKLCLGI